MCLCHKKQSYNTHAKTTYTYNRKILQDTNESIFWQVKEHLYLLTFLSQQYRKLVMNGYSSFKKYKVDGRDLMQSITLQLIMVSWSWTEEDTFKIVLPNIGSLFYLLQLTHATLPIQNNTAL